MRFLLILAASLALAQAPQQGVPVAAFGSSNVAIGATVTGATPWEVLYTDASSPTPKLAQDPGFQYRPCSDAWPSGQCGLSVGGIEPAGLPYPGAGISEVFQGNGSDYPISNYVVANTGGFGASYYYYYSDGLVHPPQIRLRHDLIQVRAPL